MPAWPTRCCRFSSARSSWKAGPSPPPLGQAVLDAESARRLGASYELLVPFLEQGSTAAVIPIAVPTELLATLTVVSLDPARRIGRESIETALGVARQAALAIDNARLYQQQKRFSDTMQRSLLPQKLRR